MENNNENRTLIRPEWVRGVETLVEDRSLRKKIKKVQEGNKKVVKAVEELKRAGMKSLGDEEWSIEKGVVIKEGYIYTVMTQPKTAKSLFIFIFIFFSFN